MEKQLFTVNFFAIAILFLSSLLFPASGYSSQNETIRSRYPAPDFNLPDLNGDATQLSDYRGSVVVMMFWTTW